MIYLVWTTGEANAANEWEYDWLSDILAKVEYTIVMNTNMDFNPQPNCIIVYNTATEQRIRDFNEYISRWNCPYGLIHLSDEYYSSSYEPYIQDRCLFVYRNYFHHDLARLPKVRFFPLGYKKGFTCNNIEWSGNKYLWSFSGKLKDRHPDRIDGCRTFMDLNPNSIVIEEGNSFNDVRTGLTTEKYCKTIAESKFV